MIWNTHTQTHRHTHLHAQMLLWDKHALTLTYVPGESNILPTINGRQKKKVKRREIKSSRRGDHRLGAQPRERKKKPGESVLRNKTVFSLPAAKGAGLRKRASRRLEAWSPPSPIPLSLFSPPRCLSFYPLISPALPPPLLLPKKGHTWTLFPFL